jgi:hypothetical protein
MSSNLHGGSRDGAGRPNAKESGGTNLITNYFFGGSQGPHEIPLAFSATEAVQAEVVAVERTAKDKAATDRFERLQMQRNRAREQDMTNQKNSLGGLIAEAAATDNNGVTTESIFKRRKKNQIMKAMTNHGVLTARKKKKRKAPTMN